MAPRMVFGSGSSGKSTTVRIPRPSYPKKKFTPRGFPKSSNSRVYTKKAARQDPMDFTNISFGQTGLTGES